MTRNGAGTNDYPEKRQNHEEKQRPLIFISHIHEHGKLSSVLTKEITGLLLGGVDFFSSSDRKSIRGGDRWLDKIEDKLGKAKVVIVICTRESICRPWVNFEAGGAWMAGKRVVPLCFEGFQPSDLPQPLASREAYNGAKSSDLIELVKLIAEEAELNMPDFDADKLVEKLVQASAAPKIPKYIAAVVAVALAVASLAWLAGRSDDCDGCPYLVVIPEGTFQMGSPASEERRYDDEGPRHGVTLRSFAMGTKEVTFDEWDACVRGGGCNGYRPDDEGWGRGARPVINVSWEDVQAYVSWLSETTGARYRLPSESEWEYAARAGTTTPFHTGATISTDQANYHGNQVYSSGRRGAYRGRTTPVGTFAPNAFGLYDVHGNVWEWVEDCWHDGYRGAPSDGTAWTRGGDCGRRVLRGGSWSGTLRDVRSAIRSWSATGDRSNRAGFRVLRTLD